MASRPKVFLTRRWPSAVEQHLSERFDVWLNQADRPLGAADLSKALREYDAVCPTVSDVLDAGVLGEGRGTAKIIGNYGVGVNHIDLEACKRLGLVVTNTPDVLTDATAELAILLMLMVARRAGEGERELRSGGWAGWRPTHMMGSQVTGKTLGLVGFGRIGQAAASKARHGLGMSILYHSRRRAEPGVEAATGAVFCPSLDDLLQNADFVSLHAPGGAETRHMIDARRLALMKPSAFLINTARGAVVDEAALAAALAQRRIAGAGLDVYEGEPVVTPGLMGLDNVVLLPHLGSATLQTRTAMGMRVAENLVAFFSGGAPPDRIA